MEISHLFGLIFQYEILFHSKVFEFPFQNKLVLTITKILRYK